ncbi:MAG: hypothetical protein HZB29_13400 [Nitrospinae bacterium]|nr:hypothetical protein [Nitrospinota bacterium]
MLRRSMEQYLIPAILIGGIVVAAMITRWANWFAWGENRMKKETLKKRMEERAATREKREKEKDEV